MIVFVKIGDHSVEIHPRNKGKDDQIHAITLAYSFDDNFPKCVGFWVMDENEAAEWLSGFLNPDDESEESQNSMNKIREACEAQGIDPFPFCI